MFQHIALNRHLTSCLRDIHAPFVHGAVSRACAIEYTPVTGVPGQAL